jgi:hypothetical protein
MEVPNPRLDELIEIANAQGELLTVAGTRRHRRGPETLQRPFLPIAARALRPLGKTSTGVAGSGQTERLMLLVFFLVFVLLRTPLRLDNGLGISYFIQCG